MTAMLLLWIAFILLLIFDVRMHKALLADRSGNYERVPKKPVPFDEGNEAVDQYFKERRDALHADIKWLESRESKLAVWLPGYTLYLYLRDRARGIKWKSETPTLKL